MVQLLVRTVGVEEGVDEATTWAVFPKTRAEERTTSSSPTWVLPVCAGRVMTRAEGGFGEGRVSTGGGGCFGHPGLALRCLSVESGHSCAGLLLPFRSQWIVSWIAVEDALCAMRLLDAGLGSSASPQTAPGRLSERVWRLSDPMHPSIDGGLDSHFSVPESDDKTPCLYLVINGQCTTDEGIAHVWLYSVCLALQEAP